ncbi:MAG: hypothetical protein RLZZ200_1202 [Pseudomonadota bacterium]
MRFQTRIFASIAASLCFGAYVSAAVITTNPGGKKDSGEALRQDAVSTVLLSGNIEIGDAEKFVAAVFSKGIYKVPVEIFLNSTGGNIEEARKIALIVHAARMQVSVENTYALQEQATSFEPFVCASSCFLIYAAGENRTAFSGYGKVGIHRPYFRNGLESTSKEASLLSGAHDEISALLRQYGTPTRLVEKMISVPSNQIYWLTDSDLAEIGFLSPAIEEIAIRECGFGRDLFDKQFQSSVARSQLKDSMTCLNERLHNERSNVMMQLQKGWRPYRR